MRTPAEARLNCDEVLPVNGTLLPLRYYFWAILLGGVLFWGMFTGHLKWHKATYACTGKYVYSKPTEWYTKVKLGSLEWRGNNAVYDCPPINQLPLEPGQKAQSPEQGTIPPGESQNWTQ
jgi:hypothetical protein